MPRLIATKPTDPLLLTTAAFAMLLAALLSTLRPVRHAVRSNPRNCCEANKQAHKQRFISALAGASARQPDRAPCPRKQARRQHAAPRKVDVNGETVRVFGRPAELAERLEASGYNIPASEIEAGIELHLPCLVRLGQGNSGYKPGPQQVRF